MNVLQLCIKPPFPPVDGGTIAMHSLSQALLSLDANLFILSVASDKHPVHTDALPQDYCQKTHFQSVYIDLNIHPLHAAAALLSRTSYNVSRYLSDDFSHTLAELLRNNRFDAVLVESLFLTPYLPLIRSLSSARVVLRAHNVEHHIWQQRAASSRNPFKRLYLSHLARTLKTYELNHLNDYDAIACISRNDADFFLHNGCHKPLFNIPFAMQAIPQLDSAPEPYSLFHIGAMDWAPNLEGIDWFLHNVWPLLHATLPQARLFLAGRKMPQHLLDLHLDGVSIIGEVPDAQQFIASKLINIVPLLSGSGLRIKIIEAMAAGKTVVSTSVGAAGINYTDGTDILIADTPEEFVNHISHCLSDPAFCRSIGTNAAELIRQHYNPTQVSKSLLACLSAPASSPSKNPNI